MKAVALKGTSKLAVEDVGAGVDRVTEVLLHAAETATR